MSDLYICRICLIHGVRGEKMNKTLKQYYEELTNTIISAQDELPKWFCFECTSLLRKYHKFREKCCNGQRLLGKILWKGQITFEAVDLINRYNEKLNSSLSYPTKTNHIKTYTAKHTKHMTIKKSFKKEIVDEVDENKIKEEIYKTPIIEAVFIDKNHVTLEEKLFGAIVPIEYDMKINKVDSHPIIEIADDKPIDLTDNNEIIDIDTHDNVINNHDNVIDNHDNDIDNHDNDIDIHHNDIDNHDNGADDDILIDNTIPSDDENIFLDIVKKAVSGENQLVFIDDLKKRGERNMRKPKKSHPKELRFMKQKKEYLIPEFWEHFKLSEEEAIEEFKKKEFSSKYVDAKFKCKDCLKGFSKWDILDRHIKLQHNEGRGPLECRFCHMRFRIKCKLAKHMINHYTIYNCLRCNMKFTNISSATLHDEYHNGVVRKCKYCGETFGHNSTYYTHIRMNHRSEHLCTLCGASFVSEAGIAQHKRIKHVDDNTEVPPDSRENYCEKCDVAFLTPEAFEEHFVNSMMHVDQSAPNDKRTKRVLKGVKRRSSIPTTCKYCGKHFSTASACMKHHVKEHRGKGRYERHICEICGASLASVSIASHMNTHTRAVMYPCDVCGMQFTSKSSHQRHQLTHTGERPHGCPLCDKRFTQRNSMKLHYRTFHLKQPYPKRNRRKKTDEVPLVESFREKSDDSAPPPPARWR